MPVFGGLVHAPGTRLGDKQRVRRHSGGGTALPSGPVLLLQARDELSAQGEELFPVGGTGELGAHLLERNFLLVEDHDDLPAVVGA